MFNMSIEESFFLQAWRKAKVILLPKYVEEAYTGSISWPISSLPGLSKLLEEIVFDQIQCCFSEHKLTTDFQHAYREGQSTCTALIQMTVDWLKEMYIIVGAVLLDVNAALILWTITWWKKTCFAILWIQRYLQYLRIHDMAEVEKP